MAILKRLMLEMSGSVTFDNDTTFARHAWLRGMISEATFGPSRGPMMFRASLRDAYASWQKDGVKNANGRIRRWLPCNTDHDALDDDNIQETAMTLNLTPRKCLQFRSPIEAFLAELGKNVDICFDGRVALRG